MTSGETTDATSAGSVICLPSGGGAVSGLGEKFSPDLFTGTGNLSVPLTLPPGRGAAAPALTLGYSTGNGNGVFGLGWQLGLPGVTRKTSSGVPRYVDTTDVFVLSGAEDLVPVAGAYPGRVRYRPRTEGLFARIEHVKDATGDYWEVWGRDGLRTWYGTPRPADVPDSWRDPAVVADPADPGRVFSWRITQTVDPLGNLVRYAYQSDSGSVAGHVWNQPVLARVLYADYGDRSAPSFLVSVDFEYSARPDPFSDYRAGFEVRTSVRCDTIRVGTHAIDGVSRTLREYRMEYDQAAFNGVSLLRRVSPVGVDASGSATLEEPLPPVGFGYSGFEPAGRRFSPVAGPLPPGWPGDPSLSLVDTRGVGLPDIVQLGPGARVWHNAGGGRFDTPQPMAEAPPYSLDQPGVSFMDADGDGRPDLVVPARSPGGPVAGYFPMAFAGGWSRRSFAAYRHAPGVSLAEGHVRLVDLDGDGLTDVLRSGTRLQAWFNDRDPASAWLRTAVTNGGGPPVDLADPRVRLADMTGDGLQDIVLLHNGNIRYWPNLGHNRWGAPVSMRDAPRLPDGYNPGRVLLADVDGDGTADLVYVADGLILLWGNQSGNAWTTEPVTIAGTPTVADRDGLDTCDLHGTGMAGLLYGRAGGLAGRPYVRFLDFTGGVKPYLLSTVDNSLGARTRVTYAPSTQEYLRDAADPATRWRTSLPFPVQVVTRVEVADQISGGTLTTEYRYRHGYWDGVEREFRGFAQVDQLDTEVFTGTGGGVPDGHYSPPVLTRSWFHPGPVAASEAGDWTELDLHAEYWSGDPAVLARPAEQVAFLAGLSRHDRRSALRALRGQVLRTEVYAVDGGILAGRPYTVTEALSGIREESPVAAGGPDRERVFFPVALGGRVTQWERGPEPMTQFTFPLGYDTYGFPTGQLAVAVPRGRDPFASATGTGDPVPYLATLSTAEYARRDDADHYLVDRAARTSGYEVVNDGRTAVPDLRDALLGQQLPPGISLRPVAHTRTYYDGDEFTGLPLGSLGEHGLPVRSEALVFTDEFLDSLYPAGDPLALGPRPPYLAPTGTPVWPDDYPADFRAAQPALAGYTHYAAGDVPGSPGGYYVQSDRCRYDVHVAGAVPRGLKVATLDPLGALSTVGYDQHDLLPTQMTNALGLTTVATYDYRVMRPDSVTDPCGTASSVTFSPAGLVTASFVRGHNGEGDHTAPSVATSYDLMAFVGRGQPASVRTVRRVHHDTEVGVPAGEIDDVLVTVAYCDGFGRVVQTRTQAEDTLFGDAAFGGGVIPAADLAPVGDTVGRTRAAGDPDNVVVSGWQIFDNKGRVVQKYEPFFSTGYEFAPPSDALLGQKEVMFYDPRGHVVRTVHPDGSEQRAVFGVPRDLTEPDDVVPTPWESYTYDGNDNAGRTHGQAAAAYQAHWNTPASAEVDALGRVVRTVARTAPGDAGSLTTRSTYDVQGNLLSITDPAGRVAFTYRYDLARRRWRADSIDAGRHDTVPDAAGQIVEVRDSKGALAFAEFDLLRRPARRWARDNAAGTVTLRGIIEYGDGSDPAQPAADRATARGAYLLGRPVRHHDEAGLTVVGAADFKGNVLRTTRQVIADAPILATYTAAAAAGWQVAPFQIDWTPPAGRDQAARDAELLAPAGYQTDTTYDALNRVVTQVLPTAATGARAELRPAYNRAGALEAVTLDGTSYVQRIAYNAKGQRTLIAHGNGVMTRYAYDPQTFRLARMRTEAYTAAEVPAPTYHPTGAPIADHGYDYDLVGNVLALRDRAPGSGIPNNPDAAAITDPVLRGLIASGDALDRRFTYDPVYRLQHATGREYAAPPPGDPWPATPRGTDVTRTQPYAQAYSYDPTGNLIGLVHSAPGGVNRSFTVTDGGADNRLVRMQVGTTAYLYGHDASGNVVAEGTSRQFDWDHADRLAAFATQTPGAEPSIHAQYLYDASGQRVTKLVRRQGGTVEVTQYVGGVLEHHRWGIGTATPGENNHIHVTDDQQRVALVRIGPAHPDDTGPAVAYHVPDHLGSSTAVLDETGALTNREEYTPFGETSFGSYTRKRYRFTGMERDEESGLSYHSARYYAPWLCRWASADPVGASGGPNLYAYAAANPVRLLDSSGHGPEIPNTAQYVADHVRAVNTLAQKLTMLEQDIDTAAQSLVKSIESGQPFDVNANLVPLDRQLKSIVDRLAGLQIPAQALTNDSAGMPPLQRTMAEANGRLEEIANRVTNEAARMTALEWAGGGPNLGEPGGLPPEQGKLPVATVVQRGVGAWTTIRRWLGFGGRVLPYGIALAAIIKDPSIKTVIQQSTGIAFGAGVEAVTRLALGRAAFSGAGFMVSALLFLPSDSPQYNAAAERQQAREAAEKELNDRASSYWDSHSGVTMAQARQHVIDEIFAQGLEELVQAHVKKLSELRSKASLTRGQ